MGNQDIYANRKDRPIYNEKHRKNERGFPSMADPGISGAEWWDTRIPESGREDTLFRTFRPDDSNRSQPLRELCAEPALTRIFQRSDLTDQPEWPKDRNRFFCFCCETTVGKPDIQIECSRSGCENFYHFEVRRNRVRHDLLIELITEHDYISKLIWYIFIP